MTFHTRSAANTRFLQEALVIGCFCMLFIEYIEFVGVAEAMAASDEGLIVFETYNQDEDISSISVMDVNGKNEEQLVVETLIGAPAWSPDGKQIAFCQWIESSWDIYIMNADGSNIKQITNGPETDTDPAWSPDGRKIAFDRESDDNGKWQIWVMDVDGNNKDMLTEWPAPDSHPYGRPAWSPDGKKIVFASYHQGSYEIFAMDSDGANVEMLTDPSPSNQFLPSWSPDGTKIIFISDQNGDWIHDIYVILLM